YFKIVIPSRGTLVVETTGSTDTYGEFYNASGTSLQSNSNSGNFKITRDVTAGIYYVKVKHRTLGTGSYSLVSRFISDDHGPRGSGTSIEPNSTTAGNIEQAGDADVFKINISRAGTLVVYTTGSTDTIGAFYKKGANLIAFDDNGGTDRNFRIERNVTAGTTYEVEVLHSDYTETGSYKLVSEFTPTPRNPRDEAIPIDLNSITSGSIDRVGDEDWFKVVIPSAGRLVAETTGTTDTKGYLYDASNSTPIGSSDTGGLGRNFKISEWLEAGTYYVAVRHSNSLVPSGDYSLVTYFNDNNDTSDGATPSSTSPEVTPDDHSNARDGATSIEPTSTTAGDLETAGDEDYFKIVIPSRGTLVVETTGSTDTYGSLLDASNTPIATDNDSGTDTNFRITQTVTAGTYYVKVSASSTGSYELVSEFTPTPSTPRDRATPIDLNGTTSGSIDRAGDEDWFKVVIPSAGRLVAYTTGSTDTKGYLYDASNSTPIATDNDSGSGRNFKISEWLEAGTYYVAVRHSNSLVPSGDYSLVTYFNDNNDTSDGETPSSTSPEVTPDDHSNTRDGATSIEPN
ncbi:MAG: pre-peptidase C-terminal domain-containing protein, partial [Sulfurovum sp.]|nr:pre-peptidase C-terminal domain-containing protein [Sulfurovum sp.]